jgi:hypothetical protein
MTSAPQAIRVLKLQTNISKKFKTNHYPKEWHGTPHQSSWLNGQTAKGTYTGNSRLHNSRGKQRHYFAHYVT